MNFLGGNGPNYHGTLSNQLLGYRADTSLIGFPLTILLGTNRIPSNTVSVFNFQSQPLSTGGKFGDKGGKSGSSQQYNYTIGAICALCLGPINGINTIWNNKTVMIVTKTIITYTVPSGGGTFNPTTSNYQKFAIDAGVYKSQSYSVGVNDYGSPGPTTLTGNQNIPAVKVGSSPGAGQYTVDSSGNYTFSGADAGTIWQIGYYFVQGNPTAAGELPLGTLALTVFTGEQGQAIWAGISGQPVPQIGYSEVAYVANAAWQLGSSAQMPNLSYEVSGPLQWGGGIIDCEPSDVITFCLTDRNAGNIPSGILGPVTQVQNYCLANGIFISPVIDTQQTVSSWLQEYLMVANSELISSEGQLKFCCYSEVSAVGNGVTYTPATQPIYDLDLSDFIVSGPNEAPVKFNVLAAQDVSNRMSIEWSDRGNQYNYSTLQREDADSVARYGPNTVSALNAHSICDQAIASKVLSVQLQRNVYQLRQCSFTLGWRHSLLEPMDVVTVLEQYPSTNRLAVRLLSMDEDENGNIACTAEVLLYGISGPTLHPGQTAGSAPIGLNALPGPVNAPTFFEPPSETQLGSVVLISISGASPNWGGCTVYVSDDGSTYSQAGILSAKAIMGELSAALPWGTDPDTSNAPAVDLRISLGELSSVPKAQTDKFNTLFLVDDELMAYEYATLTGSNQYNLESGSSQKYLRRGLYGSQATAHASGAPFSYFGQRPFQQFVYSYSQGDIGETKYFKFTSFNTAGQQEESLANVTAYPYRIELPRLPYPLVPMTALTFPPDNDPIFASNNSFAAKQIYLPVPGGIAPGIDLISYGNINSFSIATSAPTIAFISQSTTGGYLVPGTYYISVTATGSDNQETPISNIITVVVPAGTSTNKITISITLAHPSTDTVDFPYVAFGTLAGGFYGQELVFVSGTTWELQDYSPSNAFATQAPDPNFDHIVEQAQLEVHAGIYGAEVNVVGSTTYMGNTVITLKFDGSAWTTNQLVGRVITLLGLINAGIAMPLFSAFIVANTADTLTLDRDGVGAGYTPTIGDVFAIRSNANIHSSTTIGDSLYINGGSGQPGTGLTPGVEIGNVVWIIKGTGMGQMRIVASNTTTTLTISPAWTTIPDSTSIFVVLSNSIPTVQPTGSVKLLSNPPGLGYQQPIYDRLVVKQGVGNTYIVILYAADADGNLALQQYSPFREIYIYNRWAYPTVSTGSVTLDLAQSDNFEITLVSNTAVTILPPLWTSFVVPPGTPLTLYVYQDGTYGSTGGGGNRPNPNFSTAAGGFGQDLQLSANPAIQMGGSPGTRTVFSLKFHADGLWHLDNFQTGLPPG